jgi:DnaJ homolog subfamily A member 5
MPTRRCLYEELGTSPTADESEIKRAYRVAALRWHPDKNRDAADADAGERFKAVQHAYEVLSDPHERAWYDSHRTSILGGRDPAAAGGHGEEPSAGEATTVDLFAHFSATAYAGFDNAPGSFYGVYADAFATLAAEERSAGAPHSGPPFGGADSDWDTVRAFYATYEGFASRKTFGFADKWNLAEAPNRDYRRAMERENKRERAKVKKEFNALVRDLAAFVKRRDPRVRARKDAEAESREEREQTARVRLDREMVDRKVRAADARAQRDAVLDEDADGLDRILEQLQMDEKMDRRQRGARARRRRGAGGCSSSEDEEEGEDAVDGDGADDMGNVGDVGSGGEAQNATGEGGGSEGDVEEEGEVVKTGEEDEEDEEPLYCAACRRAFRTAGQKRNHEQSRKHAAAAAKLRAHLLAEDAKFSAGEAVAGAPDVAEAADSVLDGEAKPALSKKEKKAARKRIKAQVCAAGAGSDRSADSDEIAGEANGGGGVGSSEGDTASEVVSARSDASSDGRAVRKAEARMKRAQKRENKASAAASAGAGVSGAGRGGGDDVGSSFVCNVCRNVFATRNSLFAHVKEKGHALHLDAGASGRRRR